MQLRLANDAIVKILEFVLVNPLVCNFDTTILAKIYGTNFSVSVK